MCMIVHLFEMHVFVWNHSGDLLKRFLWRRPRTSDSCQKSRLKRCLAESWCLQCQIEHAEDSQFGLDEELPEKRSRGWRFGIEVKGQIPANQNDQSQKYLFEKNLDVWPAVSWTFHCRWRTRPRPRSVQLKHRNTWKCNCKRKQISFFWTCGLRKAIDISWDSGSDYHRSLLFPHSCRYWLLRMPSPFIRVVKHSLGSKGPRGWVGSPRSAHLIGHGPGLPLPEAWDSREIHKKQRQG